LVDVRLTGRQLRAVIASRPDKACVSGIRGKWDAAAAPEARLQLELADGKPIVDDAVYRVVTTNFLVTGGDGFRGFGAGAQEESPTLLRDVVVHAIEAETAAGRRIDPDSVPRFIVSAPAHQ